MLMVLLKNLFNQNTLKLCNCFIISAQGKFSHNTEEIVQFSPKTSWIFCPPKYQYWMTFQEAWYVSHLSIIPQASFNFFLTANLSKKDYSLLL